MENENYEIIVENLSKIYGNKKKNEAEIVALKDASFKIKKLDGDIETLITSGYVIISKRRDGAIVVEKDINTLVNLRDDVTDAFKENKVIRLLDAVANHIALDFEQNYAGKVVQDANGRALFKASIISYLTELQNSGAIINFNSSTDVSVEAGEQVDAYYSEIYIQPTYSVDKLYMIVNVR